MVKENEWRGKQDIFGNDTSRETVLATADALLDPNYVHADRLVVPDRTFQQLSNNASNFSYKS